MLTRFRVQGFKSLLDTEVELGAVNVFIGANGSGKSNLLEALGVLGATAFGSVEPETLRYRGVRLGTPASYKTSLKSAPSRALILSAEAIDAKYRVEYQNLLFFPTSKWRIEGETLSGDSRQLVLRDKVKVDLYRSGEPGSHSFAITEDQSAAMLSVRFQPENVPYVENARRFLKELEDYAIFSPSTPALRGVADDIAREPLGLGGSGLPQAIESMIDRENATLGPFPFEDVWELIEWAEDLVTVPASNANVSPSLRTGPKVIEFIDRFMRGDQKSVSLYEASEGAIYVLFLLALSGHENAPPLFAVDNFDQALHPRLACALTRLVTKEIVANSNRQMLATTHNPLVLDGLNLLDDRIRLFSVDRDSNGATQIKRVQVTEELMAQADQGLSLSRLWVMGRLGGVPQLL